MIDETGLRRGLSNYGDRDFALYLRRSFSRSMGFSPQMLEKPIIGIAMTASGLNNCHRIRLSVKEKRIDLLVEEAEIARRMAAHTRPPSPLRGYRGLYARTVSQAPEGCDFAVLQHVSTARWSGLEES